ncbi:hypothetical protein IU414_17765 [Nocardia farcinica]|uniref:hypothetical protein n=1 Tax=Nocardia farcinica TaxID=37329 RepID=UPI001895658B|nr:hypothetical protein [Nocardia farcinica]MBF6254023.1 hypothetical protein [Nocardia farcinica]MBF6265577.1 hypothetical protein [Nocardia farcinica]MBF6284161.1 hypothetical protein [Nocardia farcinica]MBF6308195.1 hypothetical protein [Nocardia farcinica]MBF6511560.1 hypothetical protein [Nocardia farcinica]
MIDHGHNGFEVPPGKLAGWGVGTDLLAQLVGAAYDECPSCPEPLLVLVGESAPTTAQLVELACAGVIDTLGGLPVDLADLDSVDSPVPIGFRRLALTVAERGDAATLAAQSEALTVADRRAAARTATAVFVTTIRIGVERLRG